MLSPPSSHDGSITDSEMEVLFPILSDVENDPNFGATGIKDENSSVTTRVVKVQPTRKCTLTGYSTKGPVTLQQKQPVTAKVTTFSVHDFDRVPKYATSGSMSKNAILARENRQRKKQYIEGLEQQVANFIEEKEDLRSKLQDANKMIVDLHDEISYLKSVIANETTIGCILQNIPTVKGIKLKTQLAEEAASAVLTPYCSKQNKRSRATSIKGSNFEPESKRRAGVCIHVTDSTVSLECCNQCNKTAHQN